MTAPMIAPALPDVDIGETIEHDPRTAEPGDHERFAHIVVPASAVTEAYVLGTPVTALCGKSWIPNRDPKRYPICPTCKSVQDRLRRDFLPLPT